MAKLTLDPRTWVDGITSTFRWLSDVFTRDIDTGETTGVAEYTTRELARLGGPDAETEQASRRLWDAVILAEFGTLPTRGAYEYYDGSDWKTVKLARSNAWASSGQSGGPVLAENGFLVGVNCHGFDVQNPPPEDRRGECTEFLASATISYGIGSESIGLVLPLVGESTPDGEASRVNEAVFQIQVPGEDVYITCARRWGAGTGLNGQWLLSLSCAVGPEHL